MNVKAFFVDALGGALELGVGTPDDVLRHVTPDILATHLPRPLWARCSPRVSARRRSTRSSSSRRSEYPNLCEHVPAAIIWACIAEIGARSLGLAYTAPPPPVVLTRASLSPGSAPTRPRRRR